MIFPLQVFHTILLKNILSNFCWNQNIYFHLQLKVWGQKNKILVHSGHKTLITFYNPVATAVESHSDPLHRQRVSNSFP